MRIAIIDTGVFPHPDLTRPVNRIVAFRDFVNGRKRPYDDNGHGTHVAGDAAGNGWSSGGLFRGPAPQADIVAVKAFDRNGEAYDSAIIQAIEWCIANRKRLRLRVLSMSFGGPAHGACADDPLCQAIRKAVKAGLVVVAAAGNSGPRRGTIESPGNCPAAITVGAVNDRRSPAQADDRAAPFSSRGPAACARNKPDLAAPGDSIVSLRAPMSQLDRAYPFLRVGGAYFVLPCTSMSTPLVAGAVAQLLQRCPSLTPGRVKTLLKRHAFRLGAGADAVGSGELDTRFLLRRNGKKGACRRNTASTRPKCLQKSKATETPE
ncbi:S8 family peptidase [Paenibacillus cymbidii]|uniref:S8 family peptidase n=1 Tax=Paenibacillus cymbidii TaxID=1639034 RepID=UPI00107FDCB1|nr:S8 family peptidase [Paenibacillus cymbidii]